MILIPPVENHCSIGFKTEGQFHQDTETSTEHESHCYKHCTVYRMFIVSFTHSLWNALPKTVSSWLMVFYRTVNRLISSCWNCNFCCFFSESVVTFASFLNLLTCVSHMWFKQVYENWWLECFYLPTSFLLYSWTLLSFKYVLYLEMDSSFS